MSLLQRPPDGEKPAQRRFGAYLLEGTLGQGGMATVFSASHLITGERVALKLLRTELMGDEEARRRFIREARAARAVRHPNIVRIRDAGMGDHEVPYIAMERLEGESLQDILTMRRRLPVDETLEYLGPVMEAVALLHARGIVHRDLKPSNVFLVPDDDGRIVPKLLDFGIVKMLDEETAALSEHPIGTLHYMAPEQIEMPETTEPTADVWSMGVLLYRCLSGELPFIADSPTKLASAILARRFVPIEAASTGAPPVLVEAIGKAMAKLPEDRYADMGAFLRSLHQRRLLSSADIPALRNPDPLKRSSFGRRTPRVERRGRIGMAFAVLTALLVGLVAWRAPWRTPEPQVVALSSTDAPPSPHEAWAPPTTARVLNEGAPEPRARIENPLFGPPPVARTERVAALIKGAKVGSDRVDPAVRTVLTEEPRTAPNTGSSEASSPKAAESARSDRQRRRAARSAYQRAESARAQGKPLVARAAYDEALEHAPRFVAALAGRAELRRTHGDTHGALSDLEAALILEPGRPELLDARARSYLALGRLDLAIRDFGAAREADPKQAIFRQNLVAALFDRARARQSAGDHLGARSDLDRLLSLSPGNALALRRRGLLRLRAGERAGGRRDLEGYLRARPEAPDRERIRHLLAAQR